RRRSGRRRRSTSDRRPPRKGPAPSRSSESATPGFARPRTCPRSDSAPCPTTALKFLLHPFPISSWLHPVPSGGHASPSPSSFAYVRARAAVSGKAHRSVNDGGRQEPKKFKWNVQLLIAC